MTPRHCRTWRRLLVIVLILAWAGSTPAAIMEFDLRQGVADSVAVMRYLYRQQQDILTNSRMVNYSIDLTRTQLEAQRALIERAQASQEADAAKQIKLEHYQRTLGVLEIHMQRMTATDFQAIYQQRLADLAKQLEDQQILLDAKVTEYHVHFGTEPPVDLEYEEAETRLRPRDESPGILVVR